MATASHQFLSIVSGGPNENFSDELGETKPRAELESLPKSARFPSLCSFTVRKSWHQSSGYELFGFEWRPAINRHNDSAIGLHRRVLNRASKAQNTIEAVTKDNLTTGVNGQIRYRISENNLYAFLFGVTSPLEHVMGYFVSVLRERIANFVDPKGQRLLAEAEIGEGGPKNSAVELSEGVSINDLRKNLPLLNQYMEEQCHSTTGRYGIELDAALITEIDPPREVDRALSAINSTRNQVAADISTARADAEQQITMSARAVEIASNNAQAEVAPLRELADTLSTIKTEGGSECLRAYIRNLRVPLYRRAGRVIQMQASHGHKGGKS